MSFLTASLFAALILVLTGAVVWACVARHPQAATGTRHVHSLEWFSWWASCLSLVFGVVALLLAYAAYTKAAEDNRNTAALGFTARFRAEPYQTASRTMLDVADSEVRVFSKTHHSTEQWRAFTKDLYRRHDLVHVLHTELQFYDDLFECVVANICEWRVAYFPLKNELGNIHVLTGLIYDAASTDTAIREEAEAYWGSLGCGYTQFWAAQARDPISGGTLARTACPELVPP